LSLYEQDLSAPKKRLRTHISTMRVVVASNRTLFRVLLTQGVRLVPARRAHAVREARRTRTREAVHWRQTLGLWIARRALREAVVTACRLGAFGAVFTRFAGTRVDIAAGLAIAGPAQVSCAVVLTWPKMMTRRIERITVVLTCAAHIDLRLT
jgi:hypothetical protein